MSVREVLTSIIKTSARFIAEIGYAVLDAPIQLKSLFGKKKLSRSKKSSRVKRISARKKAKTRSKVRSRKKKEKLHKILKRVLVCKPVVFIYGIVFGLVFLVVPILLINWFNQLPSPDLLIEKGNMKSTKILDRKGRLLYEIYVDRKYNPVSLDQVPQDVIQATLAIEDDMFYHHNGFRFESMIRALKAIVFEDELQGGSTITQQLVKNVLLTPERTIPRKIKEIILSVLVEIRYTKDEILELYMNNTPYGGTAWGIEAASMKYFGKHVEDLNLAEASLLAGLPSAPTAYSPVISDESISKERQLQVLNRMLELGYITKDEKSGAYDYVLSYAPQADYIQAPHFVAYVKDQMEKYLGDRYLDFGGLTITTSLDLDLQDKVQNIVKDRVEKSGALKISNGAAIVLDTKTGEILAYVGSIDYFGDSWGAYDIITAYRQPGSSIKPVTYALAFESGYTPATVIDDAPVKFSSATEVYRPVNYDGKFHGRVTLRQALANSYNIPAVKLLNKVGAHNMVALGKEFGLQGWEVGNDYGLSVTLGGKEVRLLDLANVYATLSRGGVYKSPVTVLNIEDSLGYEIPLPGGDERRVVSEETSYLLSNILSDNVARTPAFGSSSSLVVPGYTVAVKTGTTDLKRDNWTFGYTPSYTVGVWVGNNDNTPMNPNLASGLSGAAPIWNSVMKEVLTGKSDEQFVQPSGIITKTDEKCGKTEVFSRGSAIPDTLCISSSKEKDKE